MRYEIEVESHKNFIRVEGNRILVGITSKPEKGKANIELTKKNLLHTLMSLHLKLK